ncbi:MAG TPA: hypothetical protein VFS21_30580 [Roseiflexaceae bacterium]|nr:hypothetical protein [Roseiflexaceae bacterium]
MPFTRSPHNQTRGQATPALRWVGLLATAVLALLNPLACLIYCEVWHHPADPRLRGPVFLCTIEPATPAEGETPRIPSPPAPPKAAPELLASGMAALPFPTLLLLLAAGKLRRLRPQWSDRPPSPPPRGYSILTEESSRNHT